MTSSNARGIILVGGFCESIELCEAANVEILGIIDRQRSAAFRGYQMLGTDEEAGAILKAHPHSLVIAPDLPEIREKLVRHYREYGAKFATLVHPRALISTSAVLGEGVLVQALANVSARVTLGAFVRVNTAANVMHDGSVGDFSTVAPNAVLLGGVRVGSRCYIGANATILPGLIVGESAVVGAGAVVTHDVAAGTTVAGNPARVLKRS